MIEKMFPQTVSNILDYDGIKAAAKKYVEDVFIEIVKSFGDNLILQTMDEEHLSEVTRRVAGTEMSLEDFLDYINTDNVYHEFQFVSDLHTAFPDGVEYKEFDVTGWGFPDADFPPFNNEHRSYWGDTARTNINDPLWVSNHDVEPKWNLVLSRFKRQIEDHQPTWRKVSGRRSSWGNPSTWMTSGGFGKPASIHINVDEERTVITGNGLTQVENWLGTVSNKLPINLYIEINDKLRTENSIDSVNGLAGSSEGYHMSFPYEEEEIICTNDPAWPQEIYIEPEPEPPVPPEPPEPPEPEYIDVLLGLSMYEGSPSNVSGFQPNQKRDAGILSSGDKTILNDFGIQDVNTDSNCLYGKVGWDNNYMYEPLAIYSDAAGEQMITDDMSYFSFYCERYKSSSIEAECNIVCRSDIGFYPDCRTWKCRIRKRPVPETNDFLFAFTGDKSQVNFNYASDNYWWMIPLNAEDEAELVELGLSFYTYNDVKYLCYDSTFMFTILKVYSDMGETEAQFDLTKLVVGQRSPRAIIYAGSYRNATMLQAWKCRIQPRPEYIDVLLGFDLSGGVTPVAKTFGSNSKWWGGILSPQDACVIRAFGLALYQGDYTYGEIETNNASGYTYTPLALYADAEGTVLNTDDMSNFYCVSSGHTLQIWSRNAYSTPSMTWKCRIKRAL